MESMDIEPSRVDSGNLVIAVAMTVVLLILTSANGPDSCILLHDLRHLIGRDLVEVEAASLDVPGMEQRLRANPVQDRRLLADFPCLFQFASLSFRAQSE
jgi:hypothetical protein